MHYKINLGNLPLLQEKSRNIIVIMETLKAFGLS